MRKYRTPPTRYELVERGEALKRINDDVMAMAPELIDFAVRILVSMPSDFPMPWMYPNGAGDLQTEWTFGDVEASLEFHSDMANAYWHQVNVKTLEDSERYIDFESEGDRQWLAKHVVETMRKAERGE